MSDSGGGTSRRELLQRAGIGAAALAVPGWLAAGCGGSGAAVKSNPSAGEWKQFAGTTLHFISENTAPTSAIAANLAPFKELTGIDIKISQLELTALVGVGGLVVAVLGWLLVGAPLVPMRDPRLLESLAFENF